MLWGDRRLRRSHGLTKRGDRLDGGIRAGERRVEKGAGGGEEASDTTEGGHCDSRREYSWPENLGSEMCEGRYQECDTMRRQRRVNSFEWDKEVNRQ